MTSPKLALNGTTHEQNESLNVTDYAKSSRELIDFVGLLRALGAHIDLELPRIVVIGNQSAGKSSLVEAISGISVPRDAGTCTRCPMECRLSHSAGPWSCQIKIRIEYDGAKRRLAVEERDFGPRLSDKAEVELMLRRAQAAVLCQNKSMETFVDMDEEDVRQATRVSGGVPFSRNVVCVELSGPDLTDLSFVDLPGIVQNAEDDVVQLVEDLVKSYISGDKSLILVTLPMSDDIENQKAARLAKLADPNGLRTIGVLTKPDTITLGSTKARDLWLDTLEGRRHPLRHGYYCTRQPDDDERAQGISGAKAREAEDAFFRTAEPWASSTHRARLGTLVLVQNISKLLTQIIRSSLPKVLSDVAAMLSGTRARLQELPPAPSSDPGAFVLGLIMKFCADTDAYVRGSPESPTLVQRNRAAYEAFKVAIRRTAPPFVPCESAKTMPSSWRGTIIGGVSGESGAQKVMYLADAKAHIKEAVTRQLPNNVPYAAKQSLIHEFQGGWEDAAMACFAEVHRTFKEVLGGLASRHFERYSGLKAATWSVIAAEIDACAEATTRHLQIILKLEAAAPFTQNTHYLSEKRDKYLSRYKDARAGRVSPERITPASSGATTTSMTFPATSNPFSEFIGKPVAPTLFKASSTPANGFSSKSSSATSQSAPSLQNGSTKPKSSGGAPASAFASDWPQTSSNAQPFSFRRAGATTTQSNADAGSCASPFSFEPRTPSGFPLNTPLPVPSSKPVTPSAPSEASPTINEQTSTKKEPTAQSPTHTEDVRTALAALAKLGLNVTEEDLGKLNPPDEYEEELELMAEVRAYFDVSYKRIIDYIPLSIDEHFLYAFSAALQGVMFERLGLGSDGSHARCQAYIAEDPYVVATREELSTKMKRLETVQKALLNFGL